MRGWRVRVAGVLFVGALFLGACGGDTDDTATTDSIADAVEEDQDRTRSDGGTDAPSATTSTVDGERAEQPAASTAAIHVRVAGGDVEGGGRKKVVLGETVTLRVTSDVADHVHVHGYDIMKDVGAGETVEIIFDATIPGVFEVELEDARIPLLELQIS